MKMRALFLLPLLFAALGAPASSQVVRPLPHQGVPDFIGWVPDELIVVLDPQARRELVVVEDAAGRPKVDDTALQALIDGYGVEHFRRQFTHASPQPFGSPVPDLTGYYKVKLGPGVELEAAVQAFSADPQVENVERIGIHAIYGEPNDPYFRGSPNPSFPYDQWHLWDVHSIDAEQAWDAEAGSSSVLVGILDSGVRYFHADLGGNVPQWGPGNPDDGGNIFVNPGEIPGNGIDDDGNGFVDDTIGWDFVSTTGGGGVSCIDQDCGGVDNDPDDGDGHGTHVAGTVGAITNNGILVSGVAGGFGPGTGVKIVPMRIGYRARYFGQITGVVRMDWAAEAMTYLAHLVDAGHNVASINCSWGSSNSGGLNAAVDYLHARDVLIVHAAGNSNSTSADFLGGKAGVMNVSATTVAGTGASFTNHGSWVDVAAPGLDVLSLYRNPEDPDPAAHYIALLSGTSMSAPHVAGIAALLESCTPSLTRAQKFDLIVGNTDPYSDSRNLGSGIANAKKALDAAGCSGTPCDLSADFGASPTSGCASLLVNFSDLSSGAGITSWNWDFGDGNGSSAQNPSHTYTGAGNYSVSLTVTSSACSDSVTKNGFISVSASPVADFSGTPTSGSVPLEVQFTSLASGNPTSWTWNFGDGNGSNVQNPSHTYQSTGTFAVSLTVQNACGSDSITKTGYITVSDAPPLTSLHVADISVTRQNLSQGNRRGVATVLIHDTAGNPVSGATVTGDFSGRTDEVGLSGVTDSSGVVVFLSTIVKGGGAEWCFQVTNVTHSTLSYAPGDNAVTQSCESGDVF